MIEHSRQHAKLPQALLAVGFAICAYVSMRSHLSILIPGTNILADIREAFVITGSALTGPWAVLIGVASGLYDPRPDFAPVASAYHAVCAVFVGWTFPRIMRLTRGRHLIPVWLGICAAYYLLVLPSACVFICKAYDPALLVRVFETDDVWRAWRVIAAAVLPEAGFTTVVTGIVFAALPRPISLWMIDRWEEVPPAFRRLSVRLTAVFFVLLILPLVVMSVIFSTLMSPRALMHLGESAVLPLAGSVLLVVLIHIAITYVLVERPLEVLTECAERLGRGEFDIKIERRYMVDELHVLAMSFEETTRRLDVMMRNLEKSLDTERRIQAALRDEEEKWRQTILYSPLPMITSNAVTEQNTLINARFTETFGYTIEDIPSVEQWWPLAYPAPGLADRMRSLWAVALEQAEETGGLMTPLEVVVTCKNGETRHVRIYSKRCGDVNIVTFDDFTERRLAEEALRQAERNYREIFNVAKDAILVQDTGTDRICDANEAAVAMFGYSSDELRQRSIADLVVDDEGPAEPETQAEFRNILADGAVTLDRRVRRKDGAVAWTEMSIVRTPIGGRHRVMAVLRDITERLRLIDTLKRQKLELEQYAFTASHDLKTPLVTITASLGFLELELAKGNLDRIKTSMDRVHAAAVKMDRLLNGLLELSRVGRDGGQRTLVAFRDLVRIATNAAAERIANRGIRLDIAPELPTLYGDRFRLLQAVELLLDNAIKFTEGSHEPVITIGSRIDGRRTVCFVKDNGIGIDAEHLDKVFGLFEKIDPQSEGIGIGLTLVSRIIQWHDGRVWAESEDLGCGAAFCFTLPPPPIQRRSDETNHAEEA